MKPKDLRVVFNEIGSAIEGQTQGKVSWIWSEKKDPDVVKFTWKSSKDVEMQFEKTFFVSQVISASSFYQFVKPFAEFWDTFRVPKPREARPVVLPGSQKEKKNDQSGSNSNQDSNEGRVSS